MFEYTLQCKTILADRYTPVNAYIKVRDLSPQSCLMESSDYHGEDNSHSFIAFNPIASISINHGKVKMLFPDGSVQEQIIGDQLTVEDAIDEFMAQFKFENDTNGYAGLFGYTAFDAVKYFEHINVMDEPAERNDAPDIYLILYKNLLVFNHYNNTLDIVEITNNKDNSQFSIFNSQFSTPIETLLNSANGEAFSFHPVGECRSTLTDEQHKENIRRCIAHCKRGDVFQIVISRRFIQEFEGDDLKLYRALRRINPSPYLFYFDFGGFRIFGSSPETHCCIRNRRAYIDPIAGTTARTGDPVKDQQNAEYLRNDPKENAEHVMLVDLARNDLSRNCHDVKVDSYKQMQQYSHVIHLVSRVSGQMDDNARSSKTFIDTFPAGTLSGAPKVKAMELITRYEPHNRGAYGGCIGFTGFNGNINQAIIIRTFISRNNQLWFQAGGGIVARSNEDYELQEVNNKLGALKQAIRMAEKI
ncbi:MAG: anthranilate synthase component I family protein [Bacteroidaceae bacterium]|nr:anthranilate synthase component I family protein [Bacteroidaceae bacterium]